MKKLEEFICHQVEVDSIYGGRISTAPIAGDCDTLTIYNDGRPGENDGDDSDWADC